MVLGPARDLPRDPQETQEPPKKHPNNSKGLNKIEPKKIKINASVVKNALRWRSHFKRFLRIFWRPNLHIFFTIFTQFVKNFVDKC